MEISELEQHVVIEPERVAPVLFALTTTETVCVPICSPVGSWIHDCCEPRNQPHVFGLAVMVSDKGAVELPPGAPAAGTLVKPDGDAVKRQEDGFCVT